MSVIAFVLLVRLLFSLLHLIPLQRSPGAPHHLGNHSSRIPRRTDCDSSPGGKALCLDAPSATPHHVDFWASQGQLTVDQLRPPTSHQRLDSNSSTHTRRHTLIRTAHAISPVLRLCLDLHALVPRPLLLLVVPFRVYSFILLILLGVAACLQLVSLAICGEPAHPLSRITHLEQQGFTYRWQYFTTAINKRYQYLIELSRFHSVLCKVVPSHRPATRPMLTAQQTLISVEA